MKSTLTSKGQITLPIKLRRRLGLEPGDVLEFDEEVPYLKARKPFNAEEMASVIGRGKTRINGMDSERWVDHLRGPVELP